MGDVRLAIDTATTRLSVALDLPGHDPVRYRVDGHRQHAAALLPLIEKGLVELGAVLADVGTVALADGPGSFTGLRVGAAVGKALGRAGGARLVVAPSLLVRAAGLAGQRTEAVLAVSDALRGEVYAGVWQFHAGSIVELLAPGTLDVEALHLLPVVDRAVGEAPANVLTALAARGLELISPCLPSATVLLGLIDREGGCREIEDLESWEPVYGRPAEAQAKWERSHGRTLPDSPGRLG